MNGLLRTRPTVCTYINYETAEIFKGMAKEKNMPLGRVFADFIETVIERQCVDEILEYMPKNIKRRPLKSGDLVASFAINSVVYRLLCEICKRANSNKRAVINSILIHNLNSDTIRHKRGYYQTYRDPCLKTPANFTVSPNTHKEIFDLSKKSHISISRLVRNIFNDFNVENIDLLPFPKFTVFNEKKKQISVALTLEKKEELKKVANKKYISFGLLCEAILIDYIKKQKEAKWNT